jgi:outer membrane biosynthesis protein TonB
MILALGLSLALHLALFNSPAAWLAQHAADEIVLPIEAALYTPPPTPSPQKPRPARPTPISLPPAPPPPAPALLQPPPVAQAAPAVPIEPVNAPPAIPAAPPEAPQPAPEPPPPARPTQRQLPETLNLDYSVSVGEPGFATGRAHFVWTRRGNRYSLVSTTEATGLVSLFVSGRIVQTSEGEIAADGLRPAQYSQQRGQGRQASARFDWPNQRVTLAAREAHLYETTQDLLCFPFHLALTARPSEAAFDLPVTDGHKLRIYRIQFTGTESLDGHDTWRFQATRFEDGSLDVWLDPALGGLPRQIRTLDGKGKTMTLKLRD